MEALQRLHNRGSISTGYDIANSLLLENSDNNKNFNHHQMSPGGDDQWSAQSNAGTNSKKATISMWIKRSKLSPSSGNGQHMRLFQFQTGGNATALYLSNDKINMYDDVTSAYLVSNRLLRDTSAWYHIVLAMDSTQSTAANRVKIYVNGVQETSWSTEDYGNQNVDLAMFSTTNVTWLLGCAGGQNSGYAFDGYMAEVHLVDGAQKAASDFGEFDDLGIWKPKEYTDSYGTLGAYYNFEDTSNNRFNDESGNGNYMDNRGGVFEGGIATDTPTNNFCTLNPLYKCADTTMTDGATNCDRTNNGNNTVRGTFVVTTGKWYWEVAVHRGTVNANYPFMGMTGNFTTEPCSWLYGDSKSFHVSGSGSVEDAGSYKGAGTAAAQDPSHSIYGFAVDIDNEELYWYTNGTANNSGNAYSISTSVGNSDEGMTPFLFMFTGANQSFNFGGYSVVAPSSAATDANGYGTFEYQPPAGYYALCTKNLALYGGTA